MNVNLNENNEKNVSNFDKFNIEIINVRKYITSVSDKSTINFKEEANENALVDFLNIGKANVFNDEDLETKVLEFVNNYSILGLMNDFPVNKYYFSNDNVILKEYNYIGNSDFTSSINLVEYFQIFFPKCTFTEIKDLIEKAKKIAETSAMQQYIDEDLNKLIINSSAYSEPLDMFIQYATYLYNVLDSIVNDKTTIYDNLRQFEVNHLLLHFEENKTISVNIPITYLKQFIDYSFIKIVSKEVNLLKICKFCNKAFIANNPKAEYDTPKCKNKANVYKNRATNK